MDAKVYGIVESKLMGENRELILGRNFNQWKTKSDLIRIISKEYKIEQESSKSFRANPVGYKEVNLFVDMILV